MFLFEVPRGIGASSLMLISLYVRSILLNCRGMFCRLGNPGDPEQRSGLMPNSVPVIANSVPV